MAHKRRNDEESNGLLIVGCVLLSLLMMMYLYNGNGCNHTKKEYLSPQRRVDVKYYYNPRCPHCLRFMGEWEKFARENPANTVKIDCSIPENGNKCINVRGVPHIVFINGDKEMVYSGERNAISLAETLKTLKKGM